MIRGWLEFLCVRGGRSVTVSEYRAYKKIVYRRASSNRRREREHRTQGKGEREKLTIKEAEFIREKSA